MKHHRPLAATAIALSASVAGLLGASAVLDTASAAPAPTVASAAVKAPVAVKPPAPTKILTAADRMRARDKARVAYQKAAASLRVAQKAKKSAATIKKLTAAAAVAQRAYGAAVANVGISRQKLSSADAVAVTAWANYLVRQAKANPKSASLARQARDASTAARIAVTQVKASTGKAPVPPEQLPPVTVVPQPTNSTPMVMPTFTTLTYTCERISPQEYTITYTMRASGGKYTDFGPRGFDYGLVNGTDQIWTGQTFASPDELSPENPKKEMLAIPGRVIGDYNLPRDSKKFVDLNIDRSKYMRRTITCPNPATSVAGDKVSGNF